MATNKTLILFTFLMTRGLCDECDSYDVEPGFAGQCNPEKEGCFSDPGSSNMLPCNDGTSCDADKDPDGWACCKAKGGRMGGSPSYPFMCNVKIPFPGYGAPASIQVKEGPCKKVTTSFSETNPCKFSYEAYDDPTSAYNTICEHPIKKTVEECWLELGGLKNGVYKCGYGGSCDPRSSGCIERTDEFAQDGKAGIADPIKCANGETCDAMIEGWSCCAKRGGRLGGSPGYPYMCRAKLPFKGYGASDAIDDAMDYTRDANGNRIGFTGKNPCVKGSTEWDTICEHMIKATAAECFDYDHQFGGLIPGAFECPFEGRALNMKCGMAKEKYKKGKCCNQPEKMVDMR